MNTSDEDKKIKIINRLLLLADKEEINKDNIKNIMVNNSVIEINTKGYMGFNNATLNFAIAKDQTCLFLTAMKTEKLTSSKIDKNITFIDKSEKENLDTIYLNTIDISITYRLVNDTLCISENGKNRNTFYLPNNKLKEYTENIEEVRIYKSNNATKLFDVNNLNNLVKIFKK